MNTVAPPASRRRWKASAAAPSPAENEHPFLESSLRLAISPSKPSSSRESPRSLRIIRVRSMGSPWVS